nr:hypothetical protein [uncultured Flavobacterium sp.]
MRIKLYPFTTLFFIILLLHSCSSTEVILSDENAIKEFNISETNFLASATINEQTGVITKRLPEFVNLKNLNIELKLSEAASISPDPKTIKDYSAPVSFTIKSESGVDKVYQVKLDYMDVNRSRSCSEANAWKWFGGDDRTASGGFLPYDRNVGTGQLIIVDNDLVPSSFSLHLREGFRYDETDTKYKKNVTLKLLIRDENLKLLGSTTTEVSGEFSGGFVPFNIKSLNIYLKANKQYVFYWYLVDGEKLGIVASNSAYNGDGSGFCFNSGYSAESRESKNTTLEDFNIWGNHPWHFNIELEGKE